MMSKNKIILLLTFFLAIVLRFAFIWNNPPLLNWDEAAFGYNAYSIGIDGRDEFGRFMPIDYIESFGDFKPTAYMYLDVIPVKIFGLNSFGVRFPSALFGSLAVLATFFLVKEIFPKKENKEKLALLSALILAISPWSIMLSRAAFEANVASFFIILGTLFFLRFVNRGKWEIIFSAIFFTLSIYTFNTARVVAPILVLVLGTIFIKRIWNNKTQVLIAIILGLIMVAPIAKFLVSPQATLRYQEVNIFSDVSVVKMANQEIANDNNSMISKIIHNRRILFAQDYLKHYFDNLSPSFLFVKGDGNPRFSTQDVGEMYLWDLPFVIIGILFLFRRKEEHWFLIPIAIILGIIPAALARETPHALRIENTLPYFQIISAYGFLTAISFLSKKRKLFVSFAFLILILNCVYFLHGLFLHYPREYSGEWEYAYKNSVSYVSQNYNKYNHFSVTQQLGRPYIYYLYLNSYDPKKFREKAQVKRDAFGFVDVKSFDKYYFNSDVRSIPFKDNILYIDIPDKIPQNAKIQKTFYLLDGNPSLVAYTL